MSLGEHALGCQTCHHRFSEQQQMKRTICLLGALLCCSNTAGFVCRRVRDVSTVSRRAADPRCESFVLQPDEVKPLIRIGSGEKEKIVNGFGLRCAAVSFFTGPIWSAAMMCVSLLHGLSDDFDRDRAIYDSTGKIWAKTWLTMTDCLPTYSGEIQHLKEREGACLYVANHASWMDIPLLCTILDPVFKFIAKGELTKVPCIGQQLNGGKHIIINRDDRKSQLRTFKEGIAWLKKGVPIMAFPEGMRSRDGRLMEFKGGLFSMAVKTEPGSGKLHLHVHPAIDTVGKTDAELVEEVRSAFLSRLPFDQHPVEPMLETHSDVGPLVTVDESTVVTTK